MPLQTTMPTWWTLLLQRTRAPPTTSFILTVWDRAGVACVRGNGSSVNVHVAQQMAEVNEDVKQTPVKTDSELFIPVYTVE